MANGLEDKSNSDDGKLRIGGGSDGGDEEDRKQPRPLVKKEEQQLIPDEDGNTRFCHFCGKGFKSGKALGGHMRIHESNRFNKPLIKPTSKHKHDDKHLKVSIPKKKILDLHPDGSDKTLTPTCPLCFKTFPSMKSMYGHMRCHPNREWRGTQPPPFAAVDDDDDDNDDASPNNGLASVAVDLASSLSSWTVRGPRGRIGKPVWWDSNDTVFLEACTNLCLLAMGKTRADCEVELIFNPQVPEFKANTLEEFVDKYIGYGPSNQATDDDEDGEIMMSSSESVETEYYTSSSEAEESASANIKHLEDISISRSSNGKLIAIPNDGYHHQKKMKLTEEYTNPPPFSPSRNPNFPGSSSKYKNMYSNHTVAGSSSKFSFDRHLTVPKPQELTQEVTPGYKCSVCGRSFNTHHGLGGHMSIHSKDKTLIDQLVSSSPSNQEENKPQKRLKLSEACSDSSKKQADGTSCLFKCKDCNRTFATGQALGGHKKFHRPAGPSTEESEREASSYSGVDRRESNLGIDLNVTPPEEEGEEDDAASSGDDSAAN